MPQRITQIILIAGFLFAITIPLVWFNGEIEFSSREKRRLASPPQLQLDWSLLNTWPEEFTAYFGDHYGLRSRFIKRNQHLKEKYFNKSPIWLVVRGEQGWLFIDKKKAIQDHIGQITLDNNTLGLWQTQLLNKQQTLEQMGIEYFFVPIPNKMTLYGQYLPPRIQAHSGTTILDRFLAYLASWPIYDAYTDIEPVLAAYQRGHPAKLLYSKSDTHWTSTGAFIAYQHIMQQLQKRLPDLENELRLDNLKVEVQRRKGDLANIINKADQARETAYTLLPKQACASSNYTPIESMALDASTAQTEEQLTVFNGCEQKSRTAVIVHDSYGEAIRPFFSESFKRVIFVTEYELDDMMELLREERPYVFLDLRVERNIPSFFDSDPLLQIKP